MKNVFGFSIRPMDTPSFEKSPKTGGFRGLKSTQEGQALTFMLIAMALGMLVITGFLAYSSTAVRVGGRDTDTLLARYAADAGLTDVVSDLIQGTDALSATYMAPSPTVNSYPVAVAISTPAPGTQPAANYQYIDPGAAYGLSSLASQSHYYFTIANVQAGSRIRVNWAFTPSNQRWKMRFSSGSGPLSWPTPAVLAQDDFESGGWAGGTGWLLEWQRGQGNATVTTSGGPYQGSYHLNLSGNKGAASRSTNLVGQTNVRLQFWAKATNFYSGDTATASVSTDGTNWTVIRVWQQSEADNVYRFEDIDLSSFSMTSAFWIKFAANMSNASNNFYVDSVQVVSQAQTAPLAQTSDTKGPGAFYVDGSAIAGGTQNIYVETWK